MRLGWSGLDADDQCSWNRGVDTSEDPLLHKSNQNNGKNGHNKLFRTPEINQSLVTIRAMFLQGNWLNLGKHSKLCGVLTCTISISPLQLIVALKINRLWSQGKPTAWQLSEGAGWVRASSKTHPGNCHYLTRRVVPRKAPHGAAQCKQPFLQWHLLKTIRNN